MPSLSYDPATEREMYPGTMAIIEAATSPAPYKQGKKKLDISYIM